MDWGPGEATAYLPQIQALASLKYDEYDGYRPGVKFVESLGSWLLQFGPADRPAALDFVIHRLVFISRAELDHVVATAYPDVIRPHLVQRTAHDLGLPKHLVTQI